MNLLPDELRLLIAIAVNASLLLSSYRIIRKWTHRSGFAAMMDTLLLHYFIQYACVCLLGLAGVLSPESLYAFGAIIAIAMFVLTGKTNIPSDPPSQKQFALLGCTWFLIGYFVALMYQLGAISSVGDDALMYHLPMPAIWLRTHHLTFFTTWFSNPANSYSPLAVEAFIAWLMAPVGNDVLAHFVQIPAMLLMFIACVELLMGMGVSAPIAGICSLAALLCRPVVSQSILVKDDLFVATFFMVALAGFVPARLRDRFGPWRIGIALGLFFATKYTALQSAPLLLLLLDAPIRAGWKSRQWLIAAGCAVVIAGPWYLRNVLVTGNPLYPVPLAIGGVQVFSGLFFPSPDPAMRTLAGIWRVLADRIWVLVLCIAIVGWIAAMVVNRKRMLKDPLLRIGTLGPLIGFGLFFLFSHAHELRYAYPSLVLLFIAPAIAIGNRTYLLIVSLIFAGLSISDGFVISDLLGIFVVGGIIGAIASVAVVWIDQRRMIPRPVFWIPASLAALALIYVHWTSIVRSARENSMASLATAYHELAPVWSAALQDSPPGSVIAYSNLALDRPMMGFDYTNSVVYIPTRAGVFACNDLPASNVHLLETEFRPYMANLLMSQPDRLDWMARLASNNVRCLVVGKAPYMLRPPEIQFAEQDPSHFRRVFDNEAAVVYRVIRD